MYPVPAAGAAKDRTDISPGLKGGNCWYVSPWQSGGASQTMWHVGSGHTSGARQCHSQLGTSQTFRQGCALGHRSLHMGSLQDEMQLGQPPVGHWFLLHVTAQCGSSHSITQLLVSAAAQRVSQRGGSHVGSQTSSHCGVSHCHVHWGVHELCSGPYAEVCAHAGQALPPG